MSDIADECRGLAFLMRAQRSRTRTLADSNFFYSIQGARVTQGRVLLNMILVRAYRKVERGVYYEDMYDRQRLTLDLKKLSINWGRIH